MPQGLDTVYQNKVILQPGRRKPWKYRVAGKVARRPWAPRTFLEFAIKTGYVLDPWKTICCPWVFSWVLENSWTVV